MSIYCRATLNYALDGVPVPVEVEIRNGREHAAELSLEDAGFELIEFPSAVSDWSESEIDAVHYREVEALARKRTGCDAVLFYPALHRNPRVAADHERTGEDRQSLGRGRAQHNDQIGRLDLPPHAPVQPYSDA